MSENIKELGVQPLDAVLTELKLKSHDLVAVSYEQLTHRMVAKGRKGRRLTLNAQTKILTALNRAQDRKIYTLRDIFNYRAEK